MNQHAAKSVRFGSSWSTQFRLTQAIGRGLSALIPVEATVKVIGPGGLSALGSAEIDICFLKSVNNEHRYRGKGLFAGSKPDTWLRTIAWLPQEDRFLFAVAPWIGLESFKEIAAKKPALKMKGGAAPFVLKEYGFSYDDIVSWGGRVGSMEHTSRAAKWAYACGELDAFFGDGSAHDFTAWDWVASHGYKFLDIDEKVMQSLESQGIRRNVTPSGFLPGISKTLNAVDDSHIVLSCSEKLDDEIAYNLAKAIEENKRAIELESVQLDYGPDVSVRILNQLNHWSSLTDSIERQWDEGTVGAPLHRGAKQYYQELWVL